MKYRIEKTNIGSKIVDTNNAVIELSTISNYKLLGVLLKAVALTKRESIVDTTGGATGFFKEGLTQYELSGAKLYADIVLTDKKKSLPFFKGKFHTGNRGETHGLLSYSQIVELFNPTFRAVI